MSQCHTCARTATVHPLEDYVWWVSAGKKYTSWWCAICGETYDWKQSNRLLVVQTGESVEQAKVFKAHAVLRGRCANLINALKLLANQQEDGNDLLQNIVTNHGKGSRKGLTDGLRGVIKVDNHCLACWRATPRHGNFLTSEAESCRRRVGCYNQGNS